MRPLVLAALLVLLPFADGIAGEVIRHSTLKFSLQIPDGMEREPKQERDDIVLAFSRKSARVEGRFVIAHVQRYGKLLDEAPMRQSDLRKGSRLESARWKELNVQVVREVLREDEKDYLTFVAQVPLKPEGVQVVVVGPPEDEGELRTLLGQLLAGLDGETNWGLPDASYLCAGVVLVLIVSAL